MIRIDVRHGVHQTEDGAIAFRLSWGATATVYRVEQDGAMTVLGVVPQERLRVQLAAALAALRERDIMRQEGG